MPKHFLNKTRFAVLGMGRSGVAVSTLLSKLNKKVDAYDSRKDLVVDIPDVDFHRGSNLFAEAAEVIVASPGAPPSTEAFKKATIPIVSEVEIAWEASNSEIIAITGTDGKTTTTELTHHILASSGRSTKACGNIGVTISEVVSEEVHYDNLVLEISAFQLWSTHNLKPEVVVFTNIAEDHVDYFSDFAEYVEAKKRLMQNASSTDVGVFNTSDRYVEKWGRAFPGTVFSYGVSKPEYGTIRMWIDEGTIYLEEDDLSRVFISMEDVKLIGTHNALNIMAASLGALGVGVALSDSAQAVVNFDAPRHRLQKLGTHQGILFYNDSKATNAHAAIAGLKNLPVGLTVIAGGLDKGLDLNSFCDLLVGHVKHVVLIGEITERLQRHLVQAGHQSVHACATMLDAVNRSVELTEKGGVVSLSPACSSFDMYDSYAQRGEIFMEIVSGL